MPRRGDSSYHKSLPPGTASAGHPRGGSRALGSSLAVSTADGLSEAGSVLQPDMNDRWPHEEAHQGWGAALSLAWCHLTMEDAQGLECPDQGPCWPLSLPLPLLKVSVPRYHLEVALATQEEVAVTRLDSAGALVPLWEGGAGNHRPTQAKAKSPLGGPLGPWQGPAGLSPATAWQRPSRQAWTCPRSSGEGGGVRNLSLCPQADRHCWRPVACPRAITVPGAVA